MSWELGNPYMKTLKEGERSQKLELCGNAEDTSHSLCIQLRENVSRLSF